MQITRLLCRPQWLPLGLILMNIACAQPPATTTPVSGESRTVAYTSVAGRHYTEEVKPILERRCVACHACYDAPCQLKLSSAEGLDRGVTDTPVYSAKRLVAAETTRLFIDQQSTAGWREQGFYPVLNEAPAAPDANLANSLLYRVLQLKQQHPQPQERRLDKEQFDLKLKREHHCPRVEDFEDYARKQPMAGMPYALPGISADEMQTITDWLEAGAHLPQPPPLSKLQQQQVSVWESFFNQPDQRARLVSRYIYEHLFQANLYFPALEEAAHQRSYFKLVRSRTPAPLAIDVIASRRPVDDPGESVFYYRLQPRHTTLVTKTHLPYALDPKRMHWFDQLFFKPDYQVETLPGYRKEGFTPFHTFRDIPASSRYRFLLEEAHFFIGGFIKGPVCRGPVAVDVINDQFWVFFVNPDARALPMMDDFLERQIGNLRLPGEEGSTTGILSYWTTYSDLHRKYLRAKAKVLRQVFAEQPLTLDLIWDGDGNNSNAALTVFRNFDDAAVVKGLAGNPPKTAWVVDYPLLERIHYLLTADFDVYGNVGHQLNTRLYMDFLRIEGEYNFLSLLPVETRVAERDHWYRKAATRLHDQLESYNLQSLNDPDIPYHSDNPKQELYELLQQRLKSVLDRQYELDHAGIPKSQAQQLARLHRVSGKSASILAESTIVLVEAKDGSSTLYTLLANRAHLNITSLFREQSNRLPDEDTITVTHGIIGDYPNAFLRVSEGQLEAMIDAIIKLRSDEDYSKLLDMYGVRRTDPQFWQHSDQVFTRYQAQQPGAAGRLDYNRLENR